MDNENKKNTQTEEYPEEFQDIDSDQESDNEESGQVKIVLFAKPPKVVELPPEEPVGFFELIKPKPKKPIPRSFLEAPPKKKKSFFRRGNDEVEVIPEPVVEETPDHLINIVAGSIASVLSKVLSHPLEVLKDRFQMRQIPRNEDTYTKVIWRSIPHDAKVVYMEKGLRGFWKGHSTAQFVGLFQTIALFSTFQTIRPILIESPLIENIMLCNFVAGFCSGSAMVATVHPMEAMMRRLSARSRIVRKFGPTGMADHMLGTSALFTIYRGVMPNLIQASTLYGFKFLFYNMFCDHVIAQTEYNEREEIPTLSLLSSGAAAGIVSNFLTYPMDLLKRRLDTKALERQRYRFDVTCRRLGQCTMSVVRREGFLGLYKGIVPCLMRSTVSTAVQFTVFDKMRKWAEAAL